MDDTQPWIEKYRPESIDDIVDHKNILTTLKKLINNKKFPHTLFFGPPGTGKTSTIIACAKEIYGKNYKNMILELNGSDDRGIKVIREQIKEFSEYNQLFCKGVKIVVLDEADSMTYDAQFALRRVIENYTHNTRFCLICNYISKIIPALQSRCITFRFPNINHKYQLEKLKKIVNDENLTYNLEGLNTITKISEGDMRKSINLLQSVAMATNDVNKDNVYKCAGEPNDKIFNMLIKKLLTGSFNDSLDYLIKIKKDNSISIIYILKNIIDKILNEKLSNDKIIDLIINLSEIEKNIGNNGDEDIQTYGFVACFNKIKYDQVI
tara:strand:- start:111 stop:1079 length:969 start_codon:yes stop_codon:yes gene_type:complete